MKKSFIIIFYFLLGAAVLSEATKGYYVVGWNATFEFLYENHYIDLTFRTLENPNLFVDKETAHFDSNGVADGYAILDENEIKIPVKASFNKTHIRANSVIGEITIEGVTLPAYTVPEDVTFNQLVNDLVMVAEDKAQYIYRGDDLINPLIILLEP